MGLGSSRAQVSSCATEEHFILVSMFLFMFLSIIFTNEELHLNFIVQCTMKCGLEILRVSGGRSSARLMALFLDVSASRWKDVAKAARGANHSSAVNMVCTV